MKREQYSRREETGREERECPYRGTLPLPPARSLPLPVDEVAK